MEETDRFRAEDEGCRNGVQTPEKTNRHFARACQDIEVSTDRDNIGNEMRFNFNSETRLKVELEDRFKADEEATAVGGRAEDGRRKKNERKNSFLRRNEIEERKTACGKADATCSRGT
ncbi:hypothetical protein TNCV_1747541 [Trichonephila clavipes]|nr:hypothetical protein TNCV_1747541 [Trichonephila clavipes]